MQGSLRFVPARKALMTLALNSAKGLGLFHTKRACLEHLKLGADFAAGHAIDSFEILKPFFPDLTGLTGLEIGPGDNLGVAQCCMANGAERMLCAEQFATVHESPELTRLINEKYHAQAQPPEWIRTPFEEISTPVDFIYSIDVLEHVADVPAAIRHMARLLKPGGIAVHSVDFAGHNAFQNTGIDFLTCPDWLWDLLHGHLETSNRIRYSDLIDSVHAAGMEITATKIVDCVDDARVESLRSRMSPRYAALATEDLKILQAIIVFRKPK